VFRKKKIYIELPQDKAREKAFHLFALLITSILSIWAILEARSTRKFSEEQFLQIQKPVFINKITYRANNLDVQGIEFISLKNDISIEFVECRFPKDFKGNSLEIVIGNVWHCYNIQEPLLKTLDEGFQFEPLDAGDYSHTDMEYPVEIKFIYNQNGISKHYRAIYIFYTRIYKSDKIRLQRLSFAKEITNNETAKEELNEFYVTESSGKYAYTNSYDIDSVILRKKGLKPILDLANSGCCSQEVFINPEPGNAQNNNESIVLIVPDFFATADSAREFKDELNKLYHQKNAYSKGIARELEKIKKFIDDNPYCDTKNYTHAINSNWRNEDTFLNWKDLYRDIMLTLYKEAKGD
jgi:hypothetical protein